MDLEYGSLKLVWFFLISALFMGFAITGGLDLGLGGLFAFLGTNDSERGLILTRVGPTVAGNQIWFIAATGAIFAAWPLLYTVAAPSLSLLAGFLAFFLLLRPPGLGYRDKITSPVWRAVWDFSAAISGIVPAFLIGLLFGNLLSGSSFYFDSRVNLQMNESLFSIINPYTLLMGIVSLSLLLLQASLAIQLRTPEPLQERALKAARGFGILFMISFSIAWYWTVFKIEGFTIFSMPDVNESLLPLSKVVQKGAGFWLINYQKFPVGALAPLLSLLGVMAALVFSAKKCPKRALVYSSLVIGCTLITAEFTLFPFLLPSLSFPNHSLTIWDVTAARPLSSWKLIMMLLVLAIGMAYFLGIGKVMCRKNE